jgi:hypothetical protein
MDNATMDFAETRSAFFQPRDPADTRPLAWGSPARRLRDATEPIAMISVWAEPAHREYAILGLDFLQGYAYSRACVLGEPEPGVVAATFGVFEPDMIAGVYDSARQTCRLPEIRVARLAAAVDALRAVLGDAEPPGELVAALRRGIEAADEMGRPLFAGLASLRWPTDEWGQIWHACTMLREYRGDSHLAACLAAGLSGLETNVLTELWVGWEPLAYTATRGWSSEAMQQAMDRLQARGLVSGGALTAAGTRLRDSIEEATDAAMSPVVEAIGAELDGVTERCEHYSQRIIARGWFPPDPYKRAAG